MVSLGVEGTELGAWAGKLSPLLPVCTPWMQSSGGWAALTGGSSFEVAAKGFPSPQPVLVPDLQHTWNPTSSAQVLESRHLLKCPGQAPVSTCQHSEMEGKTGFAQRCLQQPG